MANLERDVEDRFFDIITNQKDNPSSNAYGVYQKLVFYRYEEIIKNTFPEFMKYISENDLEKSVYEFMKTPPSTPFVWQIANDYRKFVKKNKIFHDKKFLYELLYFDWIEVEVEMKEYKEEKKSKFSWDNSYKLAPSARVKKFKYDIINKDYETNRENYLIIYFDFEQNEVLFREINQFIYVLIKRANKKESLEKTLKTLCKENDLELQEAKAVLEEALKELISQDALLKSK
ncbi:putative DNA-binding domain-containing protein [Poseidonibacter lekithochrous]|uniref:HvfC family peptide modification chaperone n=1 Tax=Poseidonibacter lekithochrous TaxID=1904463 RepID=UPI0008FC636E|nr:putative DNA-binding domain-containing protein [Poseidonibacter lekithochrous]QKJ21440.1 hypothetical protein ALEK_0119 [Poseidonibacter lekithochrous]